MTSSLFQALLPLLLFAILLVPAGGLPADDSGLPEPPAAEPASTAAGSAPVLEIPENVHDLGKAYKGEVLEHTFQVRNAGRSALEIRDVKPGCGCTTARGPFPRSVDPGVAGSVTLVIDTSELKSGPTSKSAELLTNGIAEDSKLTVKVDVVELLTSTPPSPRVEVIRKGPDASAGTRFTLDATPGKKVRIASLKPKNGLLAAELKEIASASRYEVQVKPTLEKDTKAIFQTEFLEADVDVDGRKLTLRLPVTVHVRERIDVLPAKSVYFAKKETESLAKGAPPSKEIEIQSLGGPGHSFQVTKVTTKGQGYRHELSTVEPGKRYRLEVTLVEAPVKPKRFVQDVIQIETDDPEVPVIKIPAMAQF